MCCTVVEEILFGWPVVCVRSQTVDGAGLCVRLECLVFTALLDSVLGCLVDSRPAAAAADAQTKGFTARLVTPYLSLRKFLNILNLVQKT